MDIKKALGKKIKEKRLNLDMTQEQLAEKIGISPKSLSQIELGNNFVSAQNLEAICMALNTEPKSLFDFNDSGMNLDSVIRKLENNKSLYNKIARIIPIIE